MVNKKQKYMVLLYTGAFKTVLYFYEINLNDSF